MDINQQYESLPIGKSKAITIMGISYLWNMSERYARRVIENMWYNNMPVCNLRSGYFRPETIEELKAYGNIIGSYKRKFLKKDYRVQRCIEQFNNVTMDSITSA
jgi:hypothetical protein